MTCTCKCLSPFRWREDASASIFMERAFTGYSTGKTVSETMTEAADRFQARTGRSMGTVHGISSKSDARTETVNTGRRKAVKG